MSADIRINGYGSIAVGRRGQKASRRFISNRYVACHVPAQNQSLRYAIHQLTYTIGMVAANAHHNGRIKSAANPSTVKLIQKIFRSIRTFYPQLPFPTANV